MIMILMMIMRMNENDNVIASWRSLTALNDDNDQAYDYDNDNDTEAVNDRRLSHILRFFMVFPPGHVH